MNFIKKHYQKFLYFLLFMLGFIPILLIFLLMLGYVYDVNALSLDVILDRVRLLVIITTIALIFTVLITGFILFKVFLPFEKSKKFIQNQISSYYKNDKIESLPLSKLIDKANTCVSDLKNHILDIENDLNTYKQIIESTDDIVWVINDDDDIFDLTIPEYWYNTYGEAIKIGEKCKLLPIVHPSDKEAFYDELMNIRKRTGTEINLQMKINLYGNDYIHIHLKGVCVEYANGNKKLIGTIADINQILLLHEKLRLNETKYQIVLKTLSDLIYEVDVPEDKSTLTPVTRWYETLGIKGEVHKHSELSVIYHDKVHPYFRKGFLDRFSGYDHILRLPNQTLNYEYKIRNANGDYMWCSHTLTVISSENGHVTKVIGQITDINEKKRRELRVVYQSRHDSLTGTYLRSQTKREFEKFVESGCKEIGILLIDVDNLEFINDTFGHQVGDAVLRHVCDTIWKNQTLPGVLGRMGDDDFMLVISDASNRETVHSICENILIDTSKPVEIENKKININIVIGVSYYKDNGSDFEDLYEKANFALYESKRNKVNSYLEYDNSIKND